jgi:DNA-binding NarL/FixJ family response regulator
MRRFSTTLLPSGSIGAAGPQRAKQFRVLVAGFDVRIDSACTAIRRDERFELLGSVAHAAACVSRSLETHPDVIVLDGDLAGGAIAAAVEIRARLPLTRLVMLHEADADEFLDAVAAGVSAYIDRALVSGSVCDAVVAAARGDVAFTQEQILQLVEVVRDPSRPRRRLAHHPELTAREWQILELMETHSTPEIAERLALSPVTVRSHTRSIRTKLGAVKRRTPVVR